MLDFLELSNRGSADGLSFRADALRSVGFFAGNGFPHWNESPVTLVTIMDSLQRNSYTIRGWMAWNVLFHGQRD